MEQTKAHQVLQVNQLLPHCLEQSDIDPADVQAFIAGMSDREYASCKALLIEIMLSESAAGRVEAIDRETGQRTAFHSIIFGGPNSHADKLLSFSFTDAATESLYPIGGLFAAIFVKEDFGMDSLPDAVEGIQAMWTNLTILRSPQDDDAIAVARAIGALSLSAKQAGKTSNPSNAELGDKTGLPTTQLAQALQRLYASRIIDNIAWGAQTDDYTHTDNFWAVRF